MKDYSEMCDKLKFIFILDEKIKMTLSPRKINLFLLAKLPSAFISGVRLKSITDAKCVTTAKYKWINQNPFGSMYFAVQAMASELATGALVLKKIQESGNKVSMLVTHNTGSYFKKVKGRVHFTCNDGVFISETLQKAFETKEGQKMTLAVTATDEAGDEVAKFTYEWSVKVKN